MKVSKTTRKTKHPRSKPAQKLERQQARLEAAEFIHNQVEQAKNERDDATLFAIKDHIAVLAQSHRDQLHLVNPFQFEKLLKFGISELIYSDDRVPQYALEAVWLILDRSRELDEDGDTRVLLGALLVSILSELAQGEDSPPASRKPSRIRYQLRKKKLT